MNVEYSFSLYLLALFLVLLLHYLFFLQRIFRGLGQLILNQNQKIPREFVSVIIPFRNESENILASLKSIESQLYPIEKFEVIYVNDSSEDNSMEILKENIKKINIKIISVPNEYSINAHKKRAVRFGIENATQAEVEEAARIANAHEFISQMPEGYLTNIGDRGSKLSGGQRQRLSIARAVLKNPPILILDEATSALDTESEKLVQDALTRLMKNRTVIVIAHRLSTIQHADEIIVLQKGEIVQRGTHSQLAAADGVYKKLYELQGLSN